MHFNKGFEGICFFLMIALVSSCPAFGDMYQWTDAQGVKHFSNKKPPETIEKFTTAPEIVKGAASGQPPENQAEEDADLEERVNVIKEKTGLEQDAWLKEKEQRKADQTEKEKKRKEALEDARAQVKYLEKKLNRYEYPGGKRQWKSNEQAIRDIREELEEAKEALRAMELHGDFSSVE